MSCNNDNSNAKEIISIENEVTDNFTTAKKIALKNGYRHWTNVSELKFTFNVARGERQYARSWVWNPKTDEVLFQNEIDTIRYNRNRLDSLIQKTDAAFINDKYWLLAPFNLVWDEGTSFSEKHKVIAPISKDTLHQLTIVYGNEGGYTPGDAYDFFYTDDYTIREWIFRESNDSVPSMITTWEDYKTFGEITLATVHIDSAATFKVYFTNISIK